MNVDVIDTPRCPVCGSRRTDPIVEDHIWECRTCKKVFSSEGEES